MSQKVEALTPPFLVIVDEKSAGEFPTLEVAVSEGQKLCDAEPLPSVWWIEDANGNHVTDIKRGDGMTLSQLIERFNQRYGASHDAPASAGAAQGTDSQPDGLQLMLRAAELHGQNSDPEHEVGDLQQILRAAWAVMTPAQRALLLNHEDVRPVVVNELGGDEVQNDAAIQTAIQAELDAAATSGGPLGALLTEFPGFALDEEVDGGDLVEWMAQNLHLFGHVPQGGA